MSQSMTDYLEDLLLEQVLNGVAAPVSGTVYAALFSGATTDALTSGGAAQLELAGDGYARVGVTSGFTVTAGTAVNTARVDFPVATADWQDATHVALFDALTSGNALLHGALSGTVSVSDGDVAAFKPSQFTVIFD